MSTRDVYIKYIGTYAKSILTLGDVTWGDYFQSHLGKSLTKASTVKLGKLAKKLYLTHIASMGLCVPNWSLLEKDFSIEKLKEMIRDAEKLRGKYGYHIQVDYSLTDSGMLKHMKERGVKGKEVLKKYLEGEPSSRKTAKSSKKTAKPSGKKTAKSSKKTKKATAVKGKTCKQYKVAELKAIAKARKKKGYSKLNKAELCKLLRIKQK